MTILSDRNKNDKSIFLIHFSKHIGLFLLLVFTGSFISESATAAYSLLNLSGIQIPAAGESIYCKSGYVQSVNVSNSSREFDQEQDGLPDRSPKTLLTNNCHSSLQLLATDSPELHRSESQILLSSSILLLSSQLFVDLIADPPRRR